MDNELSKLSSKLDSVFKEQRSNFSTFFYHIALFSAGTISLSISFLGFLNSNRIDFKSNQIFLILSWIFLTIALTTSLIRNYVYNHFGHYQVISMYNEEVYKISRKPKHKDDLKHTRDKEKLYSYLWHIAEYSSIVFFPAGIILLMIFAALELLK